MLERALLHSSPLRVFYNLIAICFMPYHDIEMETIRFPQCGGGWEGLAL